MFGVATQSDPSGVVSSVNDAVGSIPAAVPILLGVMILSGLVLLVLKMKGNSKGPGWELRDERNRPGRD